MSYSDLNIPASSNTVSLTAFDIISDTSKVVVGAKSFLKPVLPGHENLTCPVFAFLVENNTTKQRVLFDLGPRKDMENAASVIAAAYKAGQSLLPVEKDITEQLAEVGVELSSISAAIWSHAHFDHTGDMSKFPSSVDLVVGEGSNLDTNTETNPWTHVIPSDFAGRNIIRLDFTKSAIPKAIGGMKAIDYFGDGSFYVLDTPGHQHGHVCALARVAPTKFVFLGADACHHAGVFRPTVALHKQFPCPGDLIASANRSISAAHFGDGELFDLAQRTTPLLTIAEDGYFEEPEKAKESISKIANFDSNPDVFVVIAHDGSILPIVGSFPVSLNEWKEKGWKEDSLWVFTDEKNPAFRFNANLKSQ